MYSNSKFVQQRLENEFLDLIYKKKKKIMKHIKRINEFFFQPEIDQSLSGETSVETGGDKLDILLGIIKDNQASQGYANASGGRSRMAPIEMIKRMYNVHVVKPGLGSEDELQGLLDELVNSGEVVKVESRGKIGYQI